MQLLDIQKLQFSDKPAAESLMLEFLKQSEDSSIVKVELTPKPESLNSINGFVTYDNGERCFFKTHVEENEQLSEYYNASTLSKAGYPMISAKQITHRPGKQIALYEIVTLPTLFDLLKIEEDAQLAHREHADGCPALPGGESERSGMLLQAQSNLDQNVFSIYKSTLKAVFAEQHSSAPIHQLFFHRLSEQGRLGLFYLGRSIETENGAIQFNDIARLRWKINGVTYSNSISEIIDRAQLLLAPTEGPAIIGHGDAHNGNIFVNTDEGSLYMFDPAFAGLHDPLLDITKPLFHNVFARWMYFPEQVNNEVELRFKISDSEIEIEHTFFPSNLRLAHLQSRKNHVLKPTLQLLKDSSLLADTWQQYLHSSLFCCPFLTVNLFAAPVAGGTLAERYPLPIKLLGLSMAVELGSLSHEGTSKMSDLIDSIFEFQ